MKKVCLISIIALGLTAVGLRAQDEGATNDEDAQKAMLANWDRHCASCHGKDGKGNTRMGQRAGVKDYTDPKVVAKMKDEEAFKNVKEGLQVDGKFVMKPFDQKLKDEEIKALIAHIRSFAKPAKEETQ